MPGFVIESYDATHYNIARMNNKPIDLDSLRLRAIRALPNGYRREALHAYTAPVPKTALDRASVLFNWGLGAWITALCVAGLYENPASLLPALLFLPLTIYLTDFASQLGHKWLDSYASETHPLWGKPAQEFRKHHECATNLNHVPYLSHVAAFGKIMAPLFILASLVDWRTSPALGLNVVTFLLLYMNVTEIHKQAHRRDPHWFARALQKTGLTLTYEQHIRHHRPPFDSEYSVLNGWSQGLTSRLDLWRRMDRWFWRTYGELPRTWIQDPRDIPADVQARIRRAPQDFPDLLAYSRVYPERVPDSLRDVLVRA